MVGDFSPLYDLNHDIFTQGCSRKRSLDRNYLYSAERHDRSVGGARRVGPINLPLGLCGLSWSRDVYLFTCVPSESIKVSEREKRKEESLTALGQFQYTDSCTENIMLAKIIQIRLAVSQQQRSIQHTPFNRVRESVAEAITFLRYIHIDTRKYRHKLKEASVTGAVQRVF